MSKTYYKNYGRNVFWVCVNSCNFLEQLVKFHLQVIDLVSCLQFAALIGDCQLIHGGPLRPVTGL